MLDLTNYLYLSLLLISILGLAAIDKQKRLALFRYPRATILSISIAVTVFLIWDVIGISLGIFFRGNSPFMTGVLLAPELPLEELFFLILLSYNTLLVYQFFTTRRVK